MVEMRFVAVVAVVAVVAMAAGVVAGGATPYSVYFADGKYHAVEGKYDYGAAAYGTWDDTVDASGWGSLVVNTNPNMPDAVQMYAAGMLEGYATGSRMKEMYANVAYFYWGTAPAPANVTQWLVAQGEWVEAEAAKPGNNQNDYWSYAGLVQQQFHGLVAGAAIAEPELTEEMVYVLQATGDLLNLVSALADPANRPDFAAMSNAEVMDYFYAHSLCTGLIKVTPTLDNLFGAHSAWFTYGAMLRIAKAYHFPLSLKGLATKRMVFSSYPGFLVSLDDYYIMDDLVMIQTTNSVFNMSLFDDVTPNSMLSWQSVRIANALASSGPEWATLNAGTTAAGVQLNAGLYSNQYMIINLKLFSPGMPIAPGTLYVQDIIPGMSSASDLSAVLAAGYYGSYNVPFHLDIWTVSGYGEMVKKTGSQTFTYDLAPRAQIFRRNQTDVTSLDDLKALMRYNDYKNDPLSHNNPMDAICSRGDLVASNPSPGGCYDSKVSQYADMLEHTFDFVDGPTWGAQSGGDLPVFKWTSEFSATAHEGQTYAVGFDFETFAPFAADE